MKILSRCIIVWVVFFGLSGTLQAADGASEDARSIETLITTLNTDIKSLRTLKSQIERADANIRDALVFRQDERLNRLLTDYNSLANKMVELPGDSSERRLLTEKMSDFGSDLGPYLFQRLDDLSLKITEYNTAIEELSGSARVAAQSEASIFEASRIQSFQDIESFITSREMLGLSAEDLRNSMSPRLFLFAETLAGRIVGSGMARDNAHVRLASDPDNADITATIKEFGTYHKLYLLELESLILIMENLGLDSAEYQAVMLQQAETFSLKFFSSEAMINVLKGSWAAMKKAFENNAADFTIRVLVFLAVLLGFRMLSRLVKRLVRAACDRSSLDMSLLLKNILVSTSGGTVMVLGILMALSTLGISLAPMLAGLGVAGFIVGFALQDSLANFAAGAMILIYRPFDVDDLVEVPGAFGKVKKMNLVSTTITTLDNQTLVVPNSKIWGDVIKNVTAQTQRRVDLEIGIGYDDDIEHAERLLTEIVDLQDAALTDPEPTIRLHTLGESSVNFVVRVWTKTDDYWDVYWDILREVKVRFDREGISFPFPQRDVHLYPESTDDD